MIFLKLMNKIFLIFIFLSLIFNIVRTDNCEGGNDFTDAQCRELTIQNNNPAENYICVKGESGCEEKLKCSHANTDTCLTSAPSQLGYKCELNDGECGEIQIECGKEAEGKFSDTYCPLLKVNDGYSCIKGSEKCEPVQIECGKEEDGKFSDTYCPLLKVNDGYSCIKGSEKCELVQIECGKEAKGNASKDYCRLLKVPDPTKQECVKDGKEEKCILASNCEDVEVGATDIICAKFTLTDKSQKCVKEGDSCKVKTICEGAVGESNEQCAKYYVSDITEKKCVKKSNENKCEEVNKTEEEKKQDKEKENDKENNKENNKENSTTKTSENAKKSSSKNLSSSSKSSASNSKSENLKLSFILFLIISLTI